MQTYYYYYYFGSKFKVITAIIAIFNIIQRNNTNKIIYNTCFVPTYA